MFAKNFSMRYLTHRPSSPVYYNEDCGILHWHKSKKEKTNTVASSTAMAPPSPTYYQPQSNVFDLDFSLLRRRHHKWCRHHVCNSNSQTSIVLVLLICSKLYTIPSNIESQMNFVLFFVQIGLTELKMSAILLKYTVV